MKYTILIALTLLIISCRINLNNNNQNNITENVNSLDLTNNIIGTWEFIKTTNSQSDKLDSYKSSFGTVVASGPKLIYRKDKTYTKVFTPKNSDCGYWKFNSETSTIEHDLYIDSTDWVGQDLIKRKLAIKKPDGKYYELIEDKVLKLEGNEMWIDNRGLIDIYKKLNK